MLAACPCLPALAMLFACLCLVLAWAAACVGRSALAWAAGLCLGGCCLPLLCLLLFSPAFFLLPGLGRLARRGRPS
eukprot:10133518-Alexandrium_andersonii.AAC.1